MPTDMMDLSLLILPVRYGVSTGSPEYERVARHFGVQQGSERCKMPGPIDEESAEEIEQERGLGGKIIAPHEGVVSKTLSCPESPESCRIGGKRENRHAANSSVKNRPRRVSKTTKTTLNSSLEARNTTESNEFRNCGTALSGTSRRTEKQCWVAPGDLQRKTRNTSVLSNSTASILEEKDDIPRRDTVCSEARRMSLPSLPARTSVKRPSKLSSLDSSNVNRDLTMTTTNHERQSTKKSSIAENPVKPAGINRLDRMWDSYTGRRGSLPSLPISGCDRFLARENGDGRRRSVGKAGDVDKKLPKHFGKDIGPEQIFRLWNVKLPKQLMKDISKELQ